MNRVSIWLVSRALDSVEGRVWSAHTATKSRDFPCFSASWLVGDSVAVSLRCVWTRDRMVSFLRISEVVLLLSPLAYPVFSWFTCALMDIRTSQAVVRSRRHHTPCSSQSCLTDPNPIVVWKNLGSGAHSSPLPLPSPPSPAKVDANFDSSA